MNPHRATPGQAELIKAAGLDPEQWSVLLEDKLYLHIVDYSIERRERHIIEKKTGKLVR